MRASTGADVAVAGMLPDVRFGMTVMPEGQHVWLDSPDNLI